MVALDDEAWAALDGIDTWLVGCFQRQPHSTHAHLGLVLDWARRLRVRRTVLTHMGTDLDWAGCGAGCPTPLSRRMTGWCWLANDPEKVP